MIPSLVAFELRNALTEYLATTYAIGDELTRDALASFLTDPKHGIFRGPYVHIRAPYRQVDDGWVSPLEWQPADFRPYTHQAEAWKRLSSLDHEPQPTILRTGTGSGKTEAFLFPILDHCLRAAAAGERGVKALLLYPMNALADDQAGRLADLITGDPRLRGLRAGIYIGGEEQSGKHVVVEDGHLIDNRAEMRANPPDIVLTNYKMLDFLLLRAEDRELWAENGANTLKYVVLDELHSYDGAQGTDVAMLLRRLGARLGMSVPGRALGAACPVATSATLGSAPDATVALAGFGSRLFGTTIGLDAIVSDDRLSAAEACRATNYDYPIPELDELPPGIADDHEVLAAVFLGHPLAAAPGDEFNVALGDALLEHHLTRAFVEAAGDRPREWADAVDRIVVRAPSWGRWLRRDPASLDAAVADYLALLSTARRERSGRIEPLFNVQVQLWVREVSRLDRLVTDKPEFQWNDRGIATTASTGFDAANFEHLAPALPAVYCRHCGRTGWATMYQEADGRMSHSGPEIRRGSVERSPRLRMLIGATPGEVDACWYDPFGRQLAAPAVEGAAPQPDKSVCVLPTVDEAAGKRQECPSCGAEDAIRFLGTQIASLASVAIGEIFGSPQVEIEERKLLAFADSVQDAAHRAAFFTARTYRFNLRTLMSSIVRNNDGVVQLDSLGDQLLQEAKNRNLDLVYGVIPPDLERDKEIRTLWSERPSPAGRLLLNRRLGFEAVLEFGLLARVGRTLELTRSAAAEVTFTDIDGAALAALEAIRLGVGTLPMDLAQNVPLYLRGLAERLRIRGAIFHPLLDAYVAADGASYRLWGGRAPGAPVFTDRQSRPTFMTDRTGRSGFDTFARSPGRTWLVDWATRILGVSANDAPEINRRALGALESVGIVTLRKTLTGAVVYGLAPANITVHDVPTVGNDPSDADSNPGGEPVASILRCDVCSHRFAVPPPSLAIWIGAPCLRFRCTGHFGIAAIESASSYRRMYRSGRTRRVVAAEHTGQLSRTAREAVESAFKRSSGPDAPNVLTCTPTLEMGIDIGDLSAVMLTSVPRGGAASYVQRVGRAGRKTGNALVAAFAGGDPASLYFLENPLRMIDGEIRPPSCHLDSLEIIQRQFLAFLLDRAGAGVISAPTMPRDIVDVLGKVAFSNPGTSWLAVSVDAARLDPSHANQFLALFGDEVSAEVAAGLRSFADGGLELATKIAGARWQEELADLERRRERLTVRIKEIDAKTIRDPEEDDDLRALRGERAVIGSRITAQRREYTLSALERVGLLPSYNLTDESAELDAVLWSIEDDGERTQQQATFKRPAQYAIREFAPGNTYYAQGHRFVIDALDVGTGNEPLWETWRLCPDCGFGEPDLATSKWSICPRCSSAGVSDLGSQHKLLRIRRVLCIDSEERARVFDETDERDRERFDEIVSVDIDPANVERAFALRNATFGVELARGAKIRMLNMGAVERPGTPTTVAGKRLSASKFSTCMYCGVVQGARPLYAHDSIRHLGWCRTRTTAAERWENLVLSHELTTDAIRMLVPVASVEAADRLATFKAVLRLGLRTSYGGDPDHLQVVTSDMPAVAGASVSAGGGTRRNFVVLYDTIPGGTGYLDRVADSGELRGILTAARELISGCVCADEGLQACHRCLLGVADRNDIPLVTRVLALEQIDELLRDWDAEPVATVALLSIDQLEESELERLFRLALVAWDAKHDNVMIVEAPGGRQQGYDLRIGSATTATAKADHREAVRWRIREQVDIVTTSGACRPDFVFTRVDGQPIEIAVFTDGEQFHASAQNNRVADDARKRQMLLDSGRLVWNLTWADVHAFHEAVTSTTPRTPPLNGLLDRQQSQLVASLLARLNGTLSPALVTANSLEQLLAVLAHPDLVEWEKLACAAISARLAGDSRLYPSEAVPAIVRAALTGERHGADTVESRDGILVGRFGSSTAILDLAGNGLATQRWTLLNVMPDEVGIGTPEATALWRSWLGWANLGQFLQTQDRQFLLSATSLASSLDTGALHLMAGASVVSTEPDASAISGVDVPAAGQLELDAQSLRLLDPEVSDLLHAAVAHGLSYEPEYGYETPDPAGMQWQLEIAWPASLVAVVTEIDDDRDRWLETNGWDARLASAWTPLALAQAANERN